MRFGSLTEVHHWHSSFRDKARSKKFRYLRKQAFQNLLQKEVAPNTNSVLELGCGSGKFLCQLLSSMSLCSDIKISGIDWCEELCHDFIKEVRSHGYDNTSFKVEDLLNLEVDSRIHERFDLVVSGGLVEHFVGSSLEHVLELHKSFLADGGKIVLMVPNFHGIRYLWHYLFDYENFSLHSLDAMRPELVGNYYKSRGMEVLFAGYCGTFFLWWSGGDGLSPWKKTLGSVVLKVWNKLVCSVFGSILEKAPVFFASTVLIVVAETTVK